MIDILPLLAKTFDERVTKVIGSAIAGAIVFGILGGLIFKRKSPSSNEGSNQPAPSIAMNQPLSTGGIIGSMVLVVGLLVGGIWYLVSRENKVGKAPPNSPSAMLPKSISAGTNDGSD